MTDMLQEIYKTKKKTKKKERERLTQHYTKLITLFPFITEYSKITF